MPCCPRCGATLPNSSAVCECQRKRSLDPSGLHNSLAPGMSIPGMSLRVWFAGMAMQGLLASENPEEPLQQEPGETVEAAVARGTRRRAKWCFLIADAMLAESAKGGC